MKRPSLFRLLLATSLVVPLGIAAHVHPAAACFNEVAFDLNAKIRDLAQAEQALGSGKLTAAAEVALRNYPKLHEAPRLMQAPYPNTGLDPVAVRAQRIVALALVRTEGLLTIREHFEPVTADARRKNLEWSVAILRAIVGLKKSPAAVTDLAEALSKLPESRDEALSMLDSLDKKDLVTSPEAYAALAELRQAAGDEAGSAAARKRVQGMTKGKGGGAGAALSKDKGSS